MTKTGMRFKKIGVINPTKLNKYAPYLAGLLDGEGGFSIKANRSKPPSLQAYVTLQMTHEETVKWFADLLSVDYDQRPRKKTTLYRSGVFTEDDVKILLEAILYWQITKRKHTDLILELFSLKEKLSNPEAYGVDATVEKDIRLRLLDIYSEVRRLNLKGKPLTLGRLKELRDQVEELYKRKNRSIIEHQANRRRHLVVRR